ncbi:hypothetical protein ASG54_05655 [Aureimonas sp. Leaf460]|nr:hypothetical protein ASG62_00130 [Aureimonas sp. Leaf427]KQT80941.1 hypothetical protein ASG54_05655 [Aureimonas sp. Leaf460]
MQPNRIYAVGDIHGCVDKLRALEAAIIADCVGFTGSRLIVYLGDYIDRGADSAAVIDHLLSEPPKGFSRICLCGNHEEVFVDLLDGRISTSEWLQLGGDDTLLSYGFDIQYMSRHRRLSEVELVAEIVATIPEAHQAFLRGLPASFATLEQIFVHAGLRPGRSLADQAERDLLWIRKAFLEAVAPEFGRLVVHGHTPAEKPFVSDIRVNVDTGAYLGGPLTAVRIEQGRLGFLSTA